MTDTELRSPHRSLLVRQADARHEHAKGCKARLDDCKVCEVNVAWFHDLPLPALADVLTDRSKARKR